MTSFRFFHAADIHLDSPLTGLAGIEGRVAESIRTAPRRAFEALVERAIQDRVDFFVIAGDLYDGSWRDYKTGLFFAEQMGRLRQAAIPAFVLHGNHDAESQITRPLKLPDNVRVFTARKAQTFQLGELNVALHGQSFRERAVTDNLVPGYPAPLPGAFNIGVLHTALGGGRCNHANYAPCSLPELVAKGYDYWALGHVHRRQVLNERPHVVFPGNLQGRHVGETGPKGASLVTVEAGEVAAVEALTFDVVRWAVLEVDVATAGSTADVVDLMRQALKREVAGAEGRLLSARIVLQGRTGLHGRLMTDVEQLTAEARATALGLGDEAAWVEGVAVRTAAPAGTAALAAREDTLGDLQRMLKEAPADEALLGQLKADIGELIGKLPSRLRDGCEDEALAAAAAGDYAALIGQVTPYLKARLTAEDA
ncbi:MAG: DNA repair exonuclease [Rhodospirillales bacterium]|nr:DNA repair exonuclease [Rhodospirillales bacterium]